MLELPNKIWLLYFFFWIFAFPGLIPHKYSKVPFGIFEREMSVYTALSLTRKFM